MKLSEREAWLAIIRIMRERKKDGHYFTNGMCGMISCLMADDRIDYETWAVMYRRIRSVLEKRKKGKRTWLYVCSGPKCYTLRIGWVQRLLRKI